VFAVANIAPENSSAALPAHSIAGTPTRADSSGNRQRTTGLALARLARRAPGQSLSTRHIFYPQTAKISAMSRSETSTALAFNMLIAGNFSEPVTTSLIGERPLKARARRIDGGYRLTGRKMVRIDAGARARHAPFGLIRHLGTLQQWHDHRGMLELRGVVHARQLEGYGQPLAYHPDVRRHVAEMSADLEVARLITYRSAWLSDTKGPTAETTTALYRAKYTVGEAVSRITRTAPR
jgi:hypothetical protein